MAARAPVIVVDTVVWADWFNGVHSRHTDRLDAALVDQDAGLAPIILAEVLQGFRSDRDFDHARLLLGRLPLLELDVDGHVAAARLFRRLRSKGVTIRGAVDCIIAQTCLTTGVELLTTDRDFLRIARHTELRLCPV